MRCAKIRPSLGEDAVPKNQTCYWCSNPADSREHVPPRSLFPTASDTPNGKDYRSQLVTVPSCYLHNGAKSSDDEYLLCVLANSILGNNVGQDHATTKVLRAMLKSKGLAERMLHGALQVDVEDTGTGKRDPTLALKVDARRVAASIEHIARGLYFAEYQRPLPGKARIVIEFLVVVNDGDAAQRNSHYENLRQHANALFADSPPRGRTPEVFFYQLQVEDARPLIMRLTFYGGTKALAIFTQD